ARQRTRGGRCRYCASTPACGLRRQRPAELANDSSLGVSTDLRALLEMLRVLPRFLLLGSSGRAGDTSLSRNRASTERGHHTLSWTWAWREEEAVEKHLHHSSHSCQPPPHHPAHSRNTSGGS